MCEDEAKERSPALTPYACASSHMCMLPGACMHAFM